MEVPKNQSREKKEIQETKREETKNQSTRIHMGMHSLNGNAKLCLMNSRLQPIFNPYSRASRSARPGYLGLAYTCNC